MKITYTAVIEIDEENLEFIKKYFALFKNKECHYSNRNTLKPSIINFSSYNEFKKIFANDLSSVGSDFSTLIYLPLYDNKYLMSHIEYCNYNSRSLNVSNNVVYDENNYIKDCLFTEEDIPNIKTDIMKENKNSTYKIKELESFVGFLINGEF